MIRKFLQYHTNKMPEFKMSAPLFIIQSFHFKRLFNSSAAEEFMASSPGPLGARVCKWLPEM